MLLTIGAKGVSFTCFNIAAMSPGVVCCPILYCMFSCTKACLNPSVFSSLGSSWIRYTNGSFTYMGNPDCWTAKDDIGDTYLEVDLSAQTMWYYEKGKKKREMLIVSGVPNENRNTPGGVFKLFMQAKNYRLKDSNPDGSSWDTKVAYWNQLTFDGIGIHDATWQPYFGGELYKWNGSHGCINLLPSKAKEFYNLIEMNTPVFVYNSTKV